MPRQQPRKGTDKRPVDPVTRAREICLRLLTSRPRTRLELRKALQRKGIDDSIAEQVLARLNEVGLIDDASLAQAWVRSRHAYAGLARRALVAELRGKGVESSIVAEAANLIDADEEEARARQLVRKRLIAMSTGDDVTKIRRLTGMLARKGYPEGMAYRVVREELANAGESIDLLDDTMID